ncbi:MAG TPA: DNA-formamidopyrimidine glycosylase [Bacillota bacterium]|nr:DNA-formamidopyrimidine glycosylase [Bacillota bacterium]
MPELPEVETIKNTLKHRVLDKTIESVNVYWPNIIKLPADIDQFKQLLKGQTIQGINRKGKFLLYRLTDYVLVSHLRMEGKYSLHKAGDAIEKHTHVIFRFTDGTELRYKDVRKFGTMHVFKKGEELRHKPLNQLGPDPFTESFTPDYLFSKLKRTKRVIKTALLDQTIVAGLGNIYVDETLFKARIHPLTQSNHLTKKDVNKIYEETRTTLNRAIEQGGTTIRSYVNSQGEIGMFQQELFVYGQVDKPCKHCGELITKMKVGGRGTHICPNCQKL